VITIDAKGAMFLTIEQFDWRPAVAGAGPGRGSADQS
jgi:hypothetical protein